MIVSHVASILDINCLKVLIDNGANIHDKSEHSKIPLHKASRMSHKENVEYCFTRVPIYTCQQMQPFNQSYHIISYCRRTSVCH